MSHFNAHAGPSSLPRKPSAPHPSASAHPSTSKRKIPPPLPPKPIKSSHPSSSTHPNGKTSTIPLKPLQGISKTRSDSTKDGFGREVVFVTRKTGLGMLLGRCRSLVVDEGYTSLRFHAIGAAIPQSLLLLHALLDLLPYPKGEKGMWYEIKTGSVECVDEIPKSTVQGKDRDDPSGGQMVDPGKDGDSDLGWLIDVGAVEEDVPDRKARIKSTIQIDLHISPRLSKRKSLSDESTAMKSKTKTSTRNRPSKKKRQQLASKRVEEKALSNEEEMMNIQNEPVDEEEEEEEIEEIEMR
ncbi:hypothetical protein I302_107404 [Kwoniella bestiolae CBS 10118]|uniref:Uncharacterized protein n=1 Tax=Kwoniella bestiolae CBS 10118 TaxID=1296100 RepID=A0A1B9FYN5_9TREE|nr:hypothetical protein I302_06856 [Kwoniella bestiolae CBS 10118]OCF23871.1 hypothetical protein I302_06856 [Kwoniella bestiolae CBS 10118]